ncbi:MAG: RES family NAD+ phosphorylase [Hyphomicrobiales bacterium]
MSSATWTPAALRSERHAYTGECWRLVEAQHVVSTTKLTDTLEEQARLEDLLETVKPPVPPACAHLHYLLATPFRYGAAYPHGSRFRRAGRTEGVYYASEAPHTAIAELAFWRLLFFAESPETPWPDNLGVFTAFAAAVETDAAIDLSRPPLDRDGAAWRNPIDYEPCQRLAAAARTADLELIRYASVRDPQGGHNVALLTCSAFAQPAPVQQETWRLRLSAAGVLAIADLPRRALAFGRDAFATDPRLGPMRWDR